MDVDPASHSLYCAQKISQAGELTSSAVTLSTKHAYMRCSDWIGIYQAIPLPSTHPLEWGYLYRLTQSVGCVATATAVTSMSATVLSTEWEQSRPGVVLEWTMWCTACVWCVYVFTCCASFCHWHRGAQDSWVWVSTCQWLCVKCQVLCNGPVWSKMIESVETKERLMRGSEELKWKLQKNEGSRWGADHGHVTVTWFCVEELEDDHQSCIQHMSYGKVRQLMPDATVMYILW